MKAFLKDTWKTLLFFAVVGLIGGFTVGLYQMESYPLEMRQEMYAQGLTDTLLGVVSAACILAGWLILRRYRLGGCSRIAAMLMLGGAAGNMLDRFFRGYVIDMFEVLFVRFAVFNVADAALTVGTVLMAASLLLRPEEWREKHDGSN